MNILINCTILAIVIFIILICTTVIILNITGAKEGLNIDWSEIVTASFLDILSILLAVFTIISLFSPNNLKDTKETVIITTTSVENTTTEQETTIVLNGKIYILQGD